MQISAREEKALRHRVQVEGDLSWAAYMQKHQNKCLFRLRDKLVRFISHVVSERDAHPEDSDAEEAKSMSPLVVSESKSHQDSVSESDTSCTSRLAHAHALPEYRAYVPDNKHKAFILDFGSKNMTSNADLTLMNFDAQRDVENRVLQKLNSFLGRYFPHPITFETLKHVFDIQIFMNAFLFFVPEQALLFYVSGMPASSRVQKMQLRYAKRSSMTTSTRHRDFSTLFQARREALRACRVYRLLQTTSMIMTMIDDAYVSNGAWLHVLLEIQNGIRLDLAPIEYLQSAYENIHMMQNPSHHDKHRAMNKYAFRLVHALRGICIGTNSSPRIYMLAAEIVNLLHRVSRYAPDMYPNIKFSIGRLSVQNSVPNTRYRSSFRRLLTSPRSKHAFHVPGRAWETDDRVMANTILYIRAYLDDIENTIMF